MNQELLDNFDAADGLCHELRWYASRKKNLAASEPHMNGKTWADSMLEELDELQELIGKIRKAVTVPVALPEGK